MDILYRIGIAQAGKNAETITISPALRTAVLKAWGSRCGYCDDAAAEHVDHIVPRALGGPDCLANFAAACQRCNLMKTDRLLAEPMLAIMVQRAIDKAPRIRRAIARKERPDRSGELIALREDLVQARLKLARTMGDHQSPEDDEAVRRRVETGYEDACITDLRTAISKTNSEAKRIEKQRTTEQLLADLRAELLESRQKVHRCPTVGLLLTERERSQGKLDDPKFIRRRLRRIDKEAESKHRVTLGMPRAVRQEFLNLIAGRQAGEIGSGCLWDTRKIAIEFRRKDAPSLSAWLTEAPHRPQFDYKDGHGCGGSCLFGAVSMDKKEQEFSIQARSFLCHAIKRAEELKVEKGFEYRDPFRLFKPLPASHCRPVT